MCCFVHWLVCWHVYWSVYLFVHWSVYLCTHIWYVPWPVCCAVNWYVCADLCTGLCVICVCWSYYWFVCWLEGSHVYGLELVILGLCKVVCVGASVGMHCVLKCIYCSNITNMKMAFSKYLIHSHIEFVAWLYAALHVTVLCVRWCLKNIALCICFANISNHKMLTFLD